jgi:RNA polymerase sigma-70 factor (ECF subfamily)
VDLPSLDHLNSLLQAAREGSSEALGELFEAFRPSLGAIVRRRRHGVFPSKFGDSDVVQAAFAQAQIKFAQFRGDDAEEFLRWLESLTGHLTADHLRLFRQAKRDAGRERLLHEAFATADPRGQSPSERLDCAELREAVQVVLRRLPTTYRRALDMHYLEGMSVAEIVRRKGWAEDAVQRHLRVSRLKFHDAWLAEYQSSGLRGGGTLCRIFVSA